MRLFFFFFLKVLFSALIKQGDEVDIWTEEG
jgi:hypothetical protein